jgi:hypothetical protein
MNTENEKQDGEIRFFRTKEMTALTHPSDELIKMWREMFRRSIECIEINPFSEFEKKLYDALTMHLYYQLNFLSITQEFSE